VDCGEVAKSIILPFLRLEIGSCMVPTMEVIIGGLYPAVR